MNASPPPQPLTRPPDPGASADPGPATATVLRPVRAADAEAIWALLARSHDDVIGMSSLPSSAETAEAACRSTAQTVANLATGSFTLEPGQAQRVLFVADHPAVGPVGLTGVTFKRDYPNLAIEVVTSGDGLGLMMSSVSARWTRTELDSTFLGQEARGRRLGTLVSRARFLFLHLVASQIPTTVASHLRGRFDPDGSAPFWRCFGAHLVPWQNSVEAERALADDPSRLDRLAGHQRPVTAEVLESLGPVNRASLPAFHLLQAEGMSPNGMFDPIDGGPTLVARLEDTASGRLRVHGRARIATGQPDRPPPTRLDALVSVVGVDRFRAVRADIEVGEGSIIVTRDTAEALGVGPDALLAAAPLGPETGGLR